MATTIAESVHKMLRELHRMEAEAAEMWMMCACHKIREAREMMQIEAREYFQDDGLAGPSDTESQKGRGET